MSEVLLEARNLNREFPAGYGYGEGSVNIYIRIRSIKKW